MKLPAISGRLSAYVDLKPSLLNNSRRAAMQEILEQLLDPHDFEFSYQIEQAAAELARGWFENDDDKANVAKLLRKFQLDETAIEAEAFRLNAEDLERLDRMQAVLAVRFEKALRCIAEYRKSFSTELQHAADRILNSDDVPRLVSQSWKASNDKRTGRLRRTGAMLARAPALVQIQGKSGRPEMPFDMV
jgi:hypothetical protein